MAERDRHTESRAEEAGRRGARLEGEDRMGGDGVPERREPSPPRHSPFFRYVVRPLGWFVAVVLFLLAALLVVLQTEWGQERVKDLVLRRLNTLFDGAELVADELTGNLIGNFVLTDVALVASDGEQLAHVDSLEAHYNLLGLLSNRLILRNIDLINPDVWMEQQENGSWDLFNVIARDDSAAVDTVETYWTRLVIQLDRFTVVDGNVEAEFYSPGYDSTLIVRDLYAQFGEAEFGDQPTFVVEGLTAQFQPPGQPYWARVAGRGALVDNVIDVGAFRLASPNSYVRAEGRLRLPTAEAAYVEDVDFQFMTNPLTFDDVRPFIPGLNAQGRVDVLLNVEGTGRRLLVDGGAAFSRGGRVSVEGVLTPGGAGPLEYVVDAEIRQLDPTTLFGEAVQPGVVNADLDVALQGTRLEELSGEIDAVVYESRFGAYEFERSVLEAEVEDGLAAFELRTGLRGATLLAQGTARPFDEVPKYDFIAHVEDLDLGRFMDDTEFATDLNATLEIEGAGIRPETAVVDADIRLAPSTINGYLVEEAALDVHVEDEAVGFGARVLVPEGRFVATGTLGFGGDVLTYDIERGHFENFNFAALFGPDTTASSFTGTFTLEGRGTDPSALNAVFDVNLTDGRYRTIDIADADIEGSLRDGLLRAAAVVDLEQAGYFDLAVRGHPFRAPEALTIERGIFRNVDLGPLLGRPNLDTDLTGQIAGALRGFDPETLTFDGRIELDPSRINEQQINDATLVADLNDGNLDFNLYLATPEGQARLAGMAQPFQDVPTYVVQEGMFENLNLGALTGNPNLTTNLSGNVSLRGRGLDPETLTLQGTFDLQPSRINQQVINDALLTVDVQRGDVDFDLRLDLPQGDTRLAGTADLLADVPTYEITEGRFQNFNVGALLGNENLQTNLTGRVSLQGRGFDPETAVVSGRIDLGPSRINQQVIDEATLAGEIREGRLDFNLDLSLPEGLADLEGVADFTQEPVAYTIREGTFLNLNVGALLNNPNLQTDLTGTLVAEGQGLDPETMTLEAQIRLDTSQVNQQLIQSAEADIRLNDGNLIYSVTLDAPEGESRLAGTAQPFLERPTYTVVDGVFENLNLGALLGREDLETSLTGNVELEGRGFDPENMFLALEANLSNSIINDAEVVSGDVEALLEDGLVHLDTDLIFGEGRAQVNATVRPFQDRPVYEVAGTLVNVDVAEILGTDTLQAHFNADFDIRGVGLDPETMTALGTIQAESSMYEGIAVDTLYTDFQLDDGLLQLDALLLRSNVADVTGEGQIALFDTTAARVSDFEFDAYVKDIEPIRPLLGAQALAIGEGRIEGRVFGRAGDLNFDVTTDVSSFVYNDIRLSGLEGRIAGRLGPDRQLEIGELRASFDFLTLPFISLQGSEFEVAYEGDEVVFEGDVIIDEEREAHVAGRVDLRPDQRAVQIETFSMRFQGDQWELLQPATITFGEEYRVSNFLLFSGDQQIAIDGVIDPDGQQNLVVTIEEFRLATVADLLGYEGLDGTMTGSLVMTGPAYAPNVEGSLALDVISEGQAVGDLAVDLRYDNLRLYVEALLENEQQGRLAMNGFIPIDLRLAPADTAVVAAGVRTQGLQVQAEQPTATSEIELEVVAEAFSLGWIEPFLDPNTYEIVQGILDGQIAITGTLDEPELDGTLQLAQGQLRLAELDVTWHDVTAIARLENNIMYIDRADFHTEDGVMVAEGTVEFEELTLGEFDIDLSLSRFRIVDNQEYDDIVVSGTPHLSGTTQRPVLTGNVRIESGDVYLENAISPDFEIPALTQRDLNTLEEVFGYRVTEEDTATFVLFDALAMNMTLTVERNTWLRQRANPELAIQFTGRMDVLKEPFEDLRLYGTIDVIPERSYIDQFGRRFSVTSGDLVFNGPPEEFILDAEAVYVVRTRVAAEPEVVITLGISGEYGSLDLDLGSEPPMPNTDIVSYIATGRPAGEISLGVGTELAAAQLASLVESFAAEELGLDVVEIEYDIGGGAQLVVGEYVTNRLFVAVSQALGDQARGPVDEAAGAGTEFTLEYEIMDWLLLRFVGGRTSLRINLLYEQAY